MRKNLIAFYERAEEIIASGCLICGIGIMFVGVVARYVFNHPLSFVDEIAPIFIVWSTLIGYSIALRKDEHIKMDIVYSIIKSQKVRFLMDLFSYSCGILFSVFMLWYGFLSMSMQRNMHRVTQILEFPVWISYIIIPFIGVVLIIRFALLIVLLLRSDVQTQEPVTLPSTTEQCTEVQED